MNTRQQMEDLERRMLSPYAAKSADSLGRDRPLEPCVLRTDFQRDRDRIIHCKSFRRLKYKTQVFLSPEGDHYRTRLTHTLEVAQIARTISRALRLNEDLTEAIALGHDLGHTPFGHIGESVLDRVLPNGFRHNVQSVRVVEKLENGGEGLNLTKEVRDGILNHTKDGKPGTLEGRVVSYADRIAYINHDIDDAIRAGVLSPGDLPKDCLWVLGDSHGKRINNMILDIVRESAGKDYVRMSPAFEENMAKLRAFMFERVYTDSTAKAEEGKAKGLIEKLYEYFLDHVEDLPWEFVRNLEQEGREIVAADYIACMTDRFAVRTYQDLFVPKSWGN
ncbi:MAG: deoxyguanosinetriphosphate triphosphohydrolase [Christensenellales bacterium]|jgi:dGTPase